MRPWMVASIGILIAVSAIYALVTGVFEGDGNGAPAEEIDSRSRAELRDVLKKADAETKP